MSSIAVHPRTAAIRSGPTCIDLFSGAGGLAVGFRNAGFNVVGANDADGAAGATFRLNFPEATFFQGPVSALTTDQFLHECGLKVGELDCLIGGPPCQSFSYNNHHRSDSDDRARLFEHYLRIVRGLRPKTLVMENVPGMLTIGGGNVIASIRAVLKRIGYDTHVEVLSAEEFGTPQTRRRVFILGSRVGDPKEMLPVATHRSADPQKAKCSPRKGLKRTVTVWDAIGDLPELENGGGSIIASREGLRPFTQFQRDARNGFRRLYNHTCHNLTTVNLARIVHVPEGGNWRNIPRDLLPDGMKRARLSDHTKRYGRLARKGFASTLLTKCDPHWGAYVHPVQDRVISVREAARLQGFPDSFQFAGTHLTRHYEQIGNAVPVSVAYAIASYAATHIQGAERTADLLAA